jgi:Domain of unknown function (DUF4424)
MFGEGPLRVIITLILAVLACAPVRANDTTAALATGGLTFVRNPDVEMRAEDLFISAAEIRVRYRFFNNATHDVTVLVAFPMPEIQGDDVLDDGNVAIPTDDPENILGFSTVADGHSVVARVEQRVRAKGIDRTDLLRGLGVPLAPHLETTLEVLDRLPVPAREQLQNLGLVEIDNSLAKPVRPRWVLQTTHYWEQTFPARRELAIEHRYKPSVGTYVATEAETPEYRRRYCIDQNLLNALERARRGAPTDFSPFSEQRIEYILETGANWAGPIGDFRLVVDKGDPNNLVSFCGDGVKKIGPTQFEMGKNDFTPERNLYVLILDRNSAHR